MEFLYRLLRNRRQRADRPLKVYFYRDFRFFTGGHLKVYHYFQYLLDSPGFEPYIYFTPESQGVPGNPWDRHRDRWLRRWKPQQADLLFLAGMDWESLPEARRSDWPVPVINFIQHVRHADPAEPPYEFLSCKAVRVCSTQDVSDAIEATGQANGPVWIILNGMDCSDIEGYARPWSDRAYDVLIAGLKQPRLAASLARSCMDRGIRVKCLTTLLPRSEYLREVVNSRVAVFLPRPTEGVFLPPLEGMAAGCLVVCPAFIGNTRFYRDGVNCLVPDYEEAAIRSAIENALTLPPAAAEGMRQTAYRQVADQSVGRERSAFLDIIGKAVAEWPHLLPPPSAAVNRIES